MIQFTVYGEIASQGSKVAVMPKGHKRPLLIEKTTKKLKPWREAVSAAAVTAMVGRTIIDSPVAVRIDFHFKRPKSHYRSGKNSHSLKDDARRQHTQTPDVDKVVRAILDGLTKRIYQDDCQVITLAASKHWTDQKERAVIEIEELKDTELVQVTLFPDEINEQPPDPPPF